MGNVCDTNAKRQLCVDNRMKMHYKPVKREARNKFKFVLDDEDLLISPNSITTSDPSITSPTLTAPNPFKFDNATSNPNPLDIWVQKLCDNNDKHASGEAKQQNSDIDVDLGHDGSSSDSSDDENKPNLYRPNTRSRWDTRDIEPLQDDMKQQLMHLVRAHSDHETNLVHGYSTRSSQNFGFSVMSPKEDMKEMLETIDVDKFVYLEPELKKERSSVIRDESHDWDSEDMENEETQMKKYLLHLTNEHSNNSNINAIVDCKMKDVNEVNND